MIQFTKSLKAWGTPLFTETLKQEIKQLDTDLLPLQQGMSYGSYAIGENLSVMILKLTEEVDIIHAKTGIFYSGIIAGCNCADDPTPVNEQPEYCEVLFDINKTTAATTIHLLSE